MPDLNINKPAALRALGRVQPLDSSDDFEVRAPLADQALKRMVGVPLLDEATFRFRASNTAAENRPALVLDGAGVRVVGTVKPGQQVLALGVGVDWF